MTNHNASETFQDQFGPHSSASQFVIVDVEDIESSPYRDLVVATIRYRFEDLVNTVADIFTWPFRLPQLLVATQEELLQRGHLMEESDPYVIIMGLSDDDDGPKLAFLVTLIDLLMQLYPWAGQVIAQRTPRQELIDSLAEDLDPLVRPIAETMLSVDAAA